MLFTLQAVGMAITLGACNLKEIFLSISITLEKNNRNEIKDFFDQPNYVWLSLLSIGGMYILVATKNPKDVFKNFSII